MRVRVAEFQPLLFVLYPVVGFAGMMQVDTILKIVRFVTPVDTLGSVGMFVVAVAYTLVLTLFLSIFDGENAIFRFVASVLLSGTCSAIFYFTALTLLWALTTPFGVQIELDRGNLQSGFALVTLLAGIVMAFVALFFVESTDIRNFSKPLIVGTQVFYLFVGMYALYSMDLAPTVVMDMIKRGH
ncbi:MAG: hypothetical protein JWM80_5985 [Cyanobacteria bacterium RYN_339]|nr:hypothetical protein [Cyanobacteria bacterium RYN_339]